MPILFVQLLCSVISPRRLTVLFWHCCNYPRSRTKTFLLPWLQYVPARSVVALNLQSVLEVIFRKINIYTYLHGSCLRTSPVFACSFLIFHSKNSNQHRFHNRLNL